MQKEQHIGHDFLKDHRENPFKAPDGYFDTFEDRLFAKIEAEKEPQKVRNKIILILKPVLGLTASFIVIYLLVYYPILYLLPDKFADNGQPLDQTEEAYEIDELSMMNEGLFYTAFTTEDKIFTSGAIIDTDEMVDYLVAELNDFDIYSEIQNQ